MAGTCINSTGEVILVYGPKSAQTPQDRDNALYRLPAGRRTPSGWDCDGVYVPNDRIADQFVGADIPGPVAIKYVDVLTFEITREGTKYKLPANQGAFKPSEVCCPSNYPTCVCWSIPNISHTQLAGYPEVPGHISALTESTAGVRDDSVAASEGTDLRYALSINGFTLSDSADGPQSAVTWDQLDISKFLHVRVAASLPSSVTRLQGRYRRITGEGSGNPADEVDLGLGTPIAGGFFEFVLTHFVLQPDSTYLIRVADDFARDTKCLSSRSLKTKRS